MPACRATSSTCNVVPSLGHNLPQPLLAILRPLISCAAFTTTASSGLGTAGWRFLRKAQRALEGEEAASYRPSANGATSLSDEFRSPRTTARLPRIGPLLKVGRACVRTLLPGAQYGSAAVAHSGQ